MAGPVLVLGGLGFFGRQICGTLADAGLKAVPASRSTGVDLRDPASLERAVGETAPQAVVCAGGVIASDLAAADPAECFGTNVTGISNLVEAISGRDCHLILISTAAVYAPSRRPLTEDSPTVPGSIYGASKLAAEKVCGWQAATGRPVTVLRVFNLVGPGQGPRQVPGEFARAVVEARREGRRRTSVPVRDPAIRRDFIDVRDAARAVEAVVSAGLEGTFNLCSGRAQSLTELAGHTASAVPGADFELELDGSLEPRPDDPDVICGDPSRLARATGWSARTTLEESLRDLVEELAG